MGMTDVIANSFQYCFVVLAACVYMRTSCNKWLPRSYSESTGSGCKPGLIGFCHSVCLNKHAWERAELSRSNLPVCVIHYV